MQVWRTLANTHRIWKLHCSQHTHVTEHWKWISNVFHWHIYLGSTVDRSIDWWCGMSAGLFKGTISGHSKCTVFWWTSQICDTQGKDQLLLIKCYTNWINNGEPNECGRTHQSLLSSEEWHSTSLPKQIFSTENNKSPEIQYLTERCDHSTVLHIYSFLLNVIKRGKGLTPMSHGKPERMKIRKLFNLKK